MKPGPALLLTVLLSTSSAFAAEEEDAPPHRSGRVGFGIRWNTNTFGPSRAFPVWNAMQLWLPISHCPNPALCLTVGPMVATPHGGLARATWAPVLGGAVLHPILSFEVPVLFLGGDSRLGDPGPIGPWYVGLGFSPGLELSLFPGLAVALEWPFTFYVLNPTGSVANTHGLALTVSFLF